MQCPHCHLINQGGPTPVAGQIVACLGCGRTFVVPGSFDPYYAWLGIPPEKQPANFYCLLGLPLFESNARLIQSAADRQTQHLRSLQAGVHAAEAERLVNEVARARICLMNSSHRAAYDEQLQRAASPQHSSAIVNAAAAEAPIQTAGAEVRARPVERRPAGQTAIRRKKNSYLATIGAIVGGMMGLAMGAMIVFYFTGMDVLGWSAKERQQAANQIASTTPGSANSTPIESPRPKSAPIELSPAKVTPAETSSAQAAPAEPPPAKATQREKTKASSAPNVVYVPTPVPVPQFPFGPPPFAAPPFGAPPFAPPPFGASPPGVPPFQAAPTPAHPNNPAQPDSLLANVPKALNLPPVDSDSPILLAPFSSTAADGLEVLIHPDLADVPGGTRIKLEKDQGEAAKSWVIAFVIEKPGGPETVPVARLKSEATGLTFAWLGSSISEELRAQLGNCLIELRHDKVTKRVQLREIEQFDPLVLIFDNDKQSIDLELGNLPPINKLNLKIHKLSNFTLGAKLRGNVRSVALGKSAYIEFTDMPGPEIELRLFRLGPAKPISILCDASFAERGKREFDLTFPSLTRAKENAHAFVKRLEAESEQLQANLKEAQWDLDRINGQRPNGIQQVVVWNNQVAAASGRVQKITQRLRSVERDLPIHKAREDAVPIIRNFLNAHHRRAQLVVALCATSGDKEIVLAESGTSALTDYDRISAVIGAAATNYYHAVGVSE